MIIKELNADVVTVCFEKNEILDLSNLLTHLPEGNCMEDYPLIKGIHQICNLALQGWFDFGEFEKTDKKYQDYKDEVRKNERATGKEEINEINS